MPLDRLKASLEIQGTAQDEELRILLARVGRAFAGEHGLQREPWLQVYEERLAGHGGYLLRLSRWPIVTVSSVLHQGEEVSGWWAGGLQRRDTLHSDDLFRSSRPSLPMTSGSFPLDYTVSYSAGWLMPEQVRTWEPEMLVSQGDWVRSSDSSIVQRFQAGATGTVGAVEPTWPAVGETIIDGGLSWLALDAEELPVDLEMAAIWQAKQWLEDPEVPRGVAEEEFDGASVKYDGATIVDPLGRLASAVVRGYR